MQLRAADSTQIVERESRVQAVDPGEDEDASLIRDAGLAAMAPATA